MKKKQTKEPFIKTRKKFDNSIEIEMKKSPAETKVGKVTVALIVAGTVLVPLAALIYVIVEKISR